MSTVRLARRSDLPSLVKMFEISEVSAVVKPPDRAEEIWQQMLAREGVFLFIVEVDGEVVATCTLATVPNLLRSGRQHGFLENVVTHPEHRGAGHGTSVVEAALQHAWLSGCHHVLMQSGRADPRVHLFYERLGFKPGLRTAYVAMRPPSGE